MILKIIYRKIGCSTCDIERCRELQEYLYENQEIDFLAGKFVDLYEYDKRLQEFSEILESCDRLSEGKK